jgi:TPP-dependent pyruvate/acetoin dehydrogenase alpha subunit
MGVVYREDSEVLEWRKRDPIALMEAALAEQGILSAEQATAFRDSTLAEVREAITFAEESPFPSPDALLEDIYTLAGSET